MDFLTSVGVSAITLQKVKEYNGEAVVTDLYLNRIKVMEIIKYLSSIGINVVDKLLIYNVDVFLLSVENIKNKIDEYGVYKFVTDINQDYSQISDII